MLCVLVTPTTLCNLHYNITPPAYFCIYYIKYRFLYCWIVLTNSSGHVLVKPCICDRRLGSATVCDILPCAKSCLSRCMTCCLVWFKEACLE